MADDSMWRRSSFCSEGSCVEVAFDHGLVFVRGTGAQPIEELAFTPPEWAAFVEGAKAGEFDLEGL